ncbi:MAG: FAD-dependent oxidoreductase [Casimicrobium sp.]
MGIEFASYPFVATRFAAVVPPLTDGVDAKRRPVVVVGGGPVGMVTALGLANHGVPVVLIEADDTVCFGSRAICISRRSLEIIERLGAIEGFKRIGLPWTGGRSFYRDVEVLKFSMPQDENQKHAPMVNLAQYHIEQILLNQVETRSDLIEVRWQTKVTAIEQDELGARLSLSTPDGTYQLDADWIVAADGGRSFIRESMGLALTGTSYEGRYVIVDILLESARPAERLAYFDPACNRGSTVLVHKQPDNVWRIDYQLQDGEDPDEAVKPENVMPRVESLLAMMGETSPWKPIWITIYKANALTLEKYRHGRVLFAGDAAHLVPIFGVRGANSGIDDADNLAWKLAYVIKGLAADELLDSYSSERVAAAHENLSYGTKSTEFMAPPSFAFDLMRRAVLSLAVKHESVRSLINPRQTSAIAYTTSPHNAARAQTAAFGAGPAPGAVLQECPLTIVTDSTAVLGHITDLVSREFVLFVFSEFGVVQDDFELLLESLESAGVPLQIVAISRNPVTSGKPRAAFDHTSRLFPMYGAESGTGYLVRPDGHVMARWKNVRPDEVAEAIFQALDPRSTQ